MPFQAFLIAVSHKEHIIGCVNFYCTLSVGYVVHCYLVLFCIILIFLVLFSDGSVLNRKLKTRSILTEWNAYNYKLTNVIFSKQYNHNEYTKHIKRGKWL